jgi:hypothetical protein
MPEKPPFRKRTKRVVYANRRRVRLGSRRRTQHGNENRISGVAENLSAAKKEKTLQCNESDLALKLMRRAKNKAL